MRMRIGFLGLLLAWTALAHAQQCDSAVSDQANVLGGRQAEVDQATQKLSAQGADPRVVTVPGKVTNLDLVESQMEKACPSWQSPDGGRKSTLLVMMVAPDSHKMGIYYGDSLRRAVGPRSESIRANIMGPHFRGGDWAGGFIVAEDRLASALSVNNGRREGAVATTQDASRASSASSSSSSHVFLWVFLALVAALIVFAVVGLRRQNQRAIAGARQAAAFAKNNASRMLLKVNDDYKVYEVTSDNKESVQRARSLLDQASQEFSTLAGSSSGDPQGPGLDMSQLRALTFQYERIGNLLNMASTEIATGGHVDTSQQSLAASYPGQAPGQPGYPSQPGYSGQQGYPPMDPRNAPLSPGYVPVPVPIYSSGPFFQPPIVIEEPVILDRPREYNEPRQDVSRDDSNESASSSSWSDRNDSSNDDDAGGGSSSWDSDSGDSGGSDFGGDSGGGSSDF